MVQSNCRPGEKVIKTKNCLIYVLLMMPRNNQPQLRPRTEILAASNKWGEIEAAEKPKPENQNRTANGALSQAIRGLSLALIATKKRGLEGNKTKKEKNKKKSNTAVFNTLGTINYTAWQEIEIMTRALRVSSPIMRLKLTAYWSRGRGSEAIAFRVINNHSCAIYYDKISFGHLFAAQGPAPGSPAIQSSKHPGVQASAPSRQASGLSQLLDLVGISQFFCSGL